MICTLSYYRIWLLNEKKYIIFFFFYQICITNVIGIICVSDIYICLYNIVMQSFIIIPNSSKTEQISTEKQNILIVVVIAPT